MQHLIIGKGEIGNTIGDVLRENNQKVFFYDSNPKLSENISGMTFSIIHICFGYSDTFVESVNKYFDDFKPSIVIVHSTIKPGTSKKIIEHVINYIYSPVRGRHKNTLLEHVMAFDKYFYATTQKAIEKMHFIFSNISLQRVKSVESLETAKIMCTSYMYWCLMFQKVMYDYCIENKLDYNFIYKEWNETYNNMCDDETFPKRFSRPIYDNMPGGIGGHCLVPNISLIDNQITEILRKFNESL